MVDNGGKHGHKILDQIRAQKRKTTTVGCIKYNNCYNRRYKNFYTISQFITIVDWQTSQTRYWKVTSLTANGNWIERLREVIETASFDPIKAKQAALATNGRITSTTQRVIIEINQHLDTWSRYEDSWPYISLALEIRLLLTEIWWWWIVCVQVNQQRSKIEWTEHQCIVNTFVDRKHLPPSPPESTRDWLYQLFGTLNRETTYFIFTCAVIWVHKGVHLKLAN